MSAPSVWNSLSYNCRSAELLSTFKRLLKSSWTNVNTPPSSANTRLWFACDIRRYGNLIWLIDWLYTNVTVSLLCCVRCVKSDVTSPGAKLLINLTGFRVQTTNLMKTLYIFILSRCLLFARSRPSVNNCFSWTTELIISSVWFHRGRQAHIIRGQI